MKRLLTVFLLISTIALYAQAPDSDPITPEPQPDPATEKETPDKTKASGTSDTKDSKDAKKEPAGKQPPTRSSRYSRKNVKRYPSKLIFELSPMITTNIFPDPEVETRNPLRVLEGLDELGALKSLLFLRIGADIDAIYRPIPFFGFGLEIGFYWLGIPISTGNINFGFYFLDIPVRLVMRLALGPIRLQPFAGIYMTSLNIYANSKKNLPEELRPDSLSGSAFAASGSDDDTSLLEDVESQNEDSVKEDTSDGFKFSIGPIPVAAEVGSKLYIGDDISFMLEYAYGIVLGLGNYNRLKVGLSFRLIPKVPKDGCCGTFH